MPQTYTPFPPSAWKADVFALVEQETYAITQTWARLVTLAPPPPDSAGDCDRVVKAMALCDEQRLQLIKSQSGDWTNVVAPLVQLLPGANEPGVKWAKDWTHLSLMLHVALSDLQCGLYMFKAYFMRGRPYQERSSIVPVLDLPPHPAYPGGHAAQARTAALLLGALFTGDRDNAQLRDDLIKAADEVALNRVIAGIHYPTDSDAGRELADQFVPLLMANPLFRELMDAAIQDLEQALR